MGKRLRLPGFVLAAGLLAGSLPAPALADAAGDARLLQAIRSSDYAGAAAVLKARAADPDRLLADGSTPLSWAVEAQDAALVKLLLGARARPNVATNAAAAPLMLGCEHGDGAILDMLLDAGADARLTAADGVSALALCAGHAPTSVVQRLLDAGAPVDGASVAGQTPLMWAAANGRLDTLRLLLARGADVNRVSANGFTPLFFALKSGNPALPVAVLEAGGNPDHVGPEGATAAQLAIFQKDYAFAARMIERGADLTAFDRNGLTLLQAAVADNQPELVRLLLAKGADPNTWSGRSKVQWRYEPNFRSGDYEPPSRPPLLVAAEKGAADVIQLLVDAGADPAVRMPDGTTLLHAAVMSDRVAAVAAALELQPDVNARDAKGRTPLHRIIKLRRYPGSEAVQILQLLASRGARADIRDAEGLLPVDLLEGREADLKAAFYASFGVHQAAR